MRTQTEFEQVRLLTGKTTDTSMPYTVIPEGTEEKVRKPVIRFDIRSGDTGRVWTEKDFLIVDCCSDMQATLTMEARFFIGEECRFSISNTLVGGCRVKCCFELKYLDSSRSFPRNLPGHLKSFAYGTPVSPEEIDRVEICVNNAADFRSFCLHRLSVSEQLPDLTISGEPLVDALGQKKSGTWKGKTCSEKELTDFLHAEYRWAETHNRYPREDYDAYGGWTGLSFEKRGRFYRHHDGKRWWLVDPEGNAFFSNGICYGNRTGIYGIVDSVEALYEELPPEDDPVFGTAWTTAAMIPEFVKRNGGEAARKKKMYNFARANMIRAFGPDHWWDAWVTINRARMKTWGFNTISVCVNDYSDEDTLRYLQNAKIPYCITLKNFPKTEALLFRDFPDVFSEEYREACEAFSRQLEPFRDDPYFIGYFITNEPEWMFQRNVNVAERTLAMKKDTVSKRVLIGRLMEKYGSTEALNRAWHTAFASADEIVLDRNTANALSDTAKKDMEELRCVLIDQYSSVPSGSLCRAAPHALDLGMRYSTADGGDFVGSSRFDVFSFNCYTGDPEPSFRRADSVLSMPFMIGEWHIGSTESGLLSGALVNAKTQKERGKACANYLRAAFSSRNCVGVHYFELNDQPLLGRFDGENMQIGLIDVCNRPYRDCVEQIAAMNADMYEILSGKKTPPKIQWEAQYRY